MKSKDKRTMTLEEARSFFFAYRGNLFFMQQEEPEKMQPFMRAIWWRRPVLHAWRKEILDSLYDDLVVEKKNEEAFIYIDDYFSLLRSMEWGTRKHIKKLLVMLDYAAAELDPQQKILIMESLAGRTAIRQGGGVYFIKRHTVLHCKIRAQMKKVVEKLADFDASVIPVKFGTMDWKIRYNVALEKMQRELR